MVQEKPAWLKPFPADDWDIHPCSACGVWVLDIPQTGEIFEADSVGREDATKAFRDGKNLVLVSVRLAGTRFLLIGVSTWARLAEGDRFLLEHECVAI